VIVLPHGRDCVGMVLECVETVYIFSEDTVERRATKTQNFINLLPSGRTGEPASRVERGFFGFLMHALQNISGWPVILTSCLKGAIS
jgi:hypothetical protein